MKRFSLIALVALAAACGGKQQPQPEPITEEPVEEPARQALEEAEGCTVEEDSALSEQPHREFAMAASTKMQDVRGEYRAHCSSAIKVKMNWGPVFRSIGMDEGESDVAVTTAWAGFLTPMTDWCKDNAGPFRTKVKEVILTPTDQPERVGMCLDEEGLLVYRFQLEEGGEGVTHWDAAQIQGWLGSDL